MAIATRVFMLAGVAAAFAPGVSTSEDTGPSGYVLESYSGKSIVTGGYGQCWHTSYWTEQQRVEACEASTAAAAHTPAAEPQAAATPTPPPTPEPPKTAQQTPPPETKPLTTDEAQATPLPAPANDSAAAGAAPQTPKLDTALLPQTVHYSTDAFFDFDEATLRAEGRAALDELVTELGEVKYGSIRVVGHTDRIGPDEYNRELSERRANAVKNYLARHNVPADRIEAVGKGKSEPTAETRNCTGQKNQKLVRCLQPDRRVDIEVAGTKEATTGSR
jgi:OOP family OmpA-OmpF porin